LATTSTSERQAPVSIRRLLFRWLLLPLVVLLGVAAIAGYPIALFPATAAYDWALMDTALSLSRLIGERDSTNAQVVSRSADILLRTDQFDHIYYAVHDERGNLIAGDVHLTPPPAHALGSSELYYDRRLNEERVRVAALRVVLKGTPVVVQVAETLVKRQRLVTRILTSMIVTEVTLVIIVVLLVWFGIGKGLQPLHALRAELESRSPRDLRPVPENHAPIEVQPVVHALNHLLGRLAAAVQAQQQFVANAAHQLRTPLAGLRMQVEYALRQENPQEWRRTLQTLKPATERAAHLANQLLTLARAEVGAERVHTMRPVDLSAVVEEGAGVWIPSAIAKEIDLGMELKPAPVSGDPVLIGEILANLVHNAIAYTPVGGSITIRTSVRNSEAILEVEDDGVGIPVAERAQVFKRFHRVDGSPGEGAGLGLAIVQEIAHVHGGHAEILTPDGGKGTRVVVHFPVGAVDGRAHPEKAAA
jgi:two-component system, OmpR family, sensor histidine kinase TctE